MNANTRSTFSGVWSNGVNVVPNRPFSSLDQRPEIGGDAREVSDHHSVAVRQKLAVEPGPRVEHDGRREIGLADHARHDRRLRLAHGHEARQVSLDSGDQVRWGVEEVGEPHRARLRLLEGDGGEHARAAREPVDHRLGVVRHGHVPVLPAGQGEVRRGARHSASERPP